MKVYLRNFTKIRPMVKANKINKQNITMHFKHFSDAPEIDVIVNAPQSLLCIMSTLLNKKK